MISIEDVNFTFWHSLCMLLLCRVFHHPDNPQHRLPNMMACQLCMDEFRFASFTSRFTALSWAAVTGGSVSRAPFPHLGSPHHLHSLSPEAYQWWTLEGRVLRNVPAQMTGPQLGSVWIALGRDCFDSYLQPGVCEQEPYETQFVLIATGLFQHIQDLYTLDSVECPWHVYANLDRIV